MTVPQQLSSKNRAQGPRKRAYSPPNRVQGPRAQARLLRLLERLPWATLDGARTDQLALPPSSPGAQTWTVTGSYKGRICGPLEADLWVCLHAVWNEQGRPADCVVRLRTADLLDRMRKPRGGKTYKLLADAVARLRAVQIVGDAVEFNGKRSRSVCGMIDAGRVEEDGSTWVRLSREICGAIQDEGRPLDALHYFRLTLPASRRLFRYLDHRQYRPGKVRLQHLDVPLSELAAELPIQRARTADQKKTLAGAHAELQRDGFLAAVSYTGRGRTCTVRYTFAPQQEQRPAPNEAPAQLPTPAPVAAPNDADGKAETLLRLLGDGHSVFFYHKAAALLPDVDFWRLHSEAKDDIHRGKAPDEVRRMFTSAADKIIKALTPEPAGRGRRGATGRARPVATP